MEFKLLCSVSHLGSTKLISVNQSTQYIDVLGQLSELWIDLVGNKFSISIQVGDVSNILIDSPEDFCNMLLMCELKGVRVVYGKVIKSDKQGRNENDYLLVSHVGDGGEIGCTDVGTDPANYVQPCINGMMIDSVGVMNNIVVPSMMNPLLSDEWRDLMKGGEGTFYYGDASVFRVALIKYCSKVEARINYVRNSPTFIHVVCFYNLDEGCNWFVKARYAEEKRSFLVYSANVTHTCFCQKFSKCSADMLTPRLIAELLIQNIQNKSDMCAKDIVDAMKVGYGFDIPYWKANRAAVIGKNIVYGNHVDSYDTMFYYCKALQLANPGSKVVFEVEPKSNRFERVFIALSASIKGFKYCVPMLFVDGTFLKGRAEGILLVAIGKDGNRGLFPFAFALVSAENIPNWAWFLSNVNACVQHESKVYYFSDRNAGLMAAFPMVFHEPVHFFCLYHLLSNLKARFSGGIPKEKRAKYHRLFKECAYELNVNLFQSKITEFRELGGKKADFFLSQLPYEKWAIAYAPIMSRFGEMTSNAAECFNAWLLAARSLPITKLFDGIRFGICRWFVERYGASKQFSGSLVPRRQEDWNCKVSLSNKWKIITCPGGVYEVLSNPSACVDIQSRVCSCKVWQAVGFPCAHVVAVIRKERSCVNGDIEVYFLTSTYQECYSGVINPVCDMMVVELKAKSSMPKIQAPILSKPPGRPRSKKRMLSYVEAAKRNVKIAKCKKCGCCNKHDLWTCGSVRKEIDLNILPQPEYFEIPL